MIYLSICIPTYNRSKYLCDTLNSIIAQPEFIETDEVEIVVSDNCSTDDTMQVMEQYLNRFPDKIKYNRNEKNVLDKNYEKVLSLGSGAVLKLNNDTLVFNKGVLAKIVPFIKQCVAEDVIPFFLNGNIPGINMPRRYHDAAKFIAEVSYWCTWIGGFCITKNAFKKMDNFSEKAALMLVQVDVLMRLFASGHEIMVIPDKFCISVPPAKKGGYNLPQVFLTNYFKVLYPFFNTAKERKIFEGEKKAILFKFVLPWLATLKSNSTDTDTLFSFENYGYENIVKSEFSRYVYIKFKILLQARIVFYRVSVFFKKTVKND